MTSKTWNPESFSVRGTRNTVSIVDIKSKGNGGHFFVVVRKLQWLKRECAFAPEAGSKTLRNRSSVEVTVGFMFCMHFFKALIILLIMGQFETPFAIERGMSSQGSFTTSRRHLDVLIE